MSSNSRPDPSGCNFRPPETFSYVKLVHQSSPTISKQILNVVSRLFRTAEIKNASTEKTIWGTHYVFGNIHSLAAPVV